MPSAMTTMFGFSQRLQARREVRRFADDAALLRLPPIRIKSPARQGRSRC